MMLLLNPFGLFLLRKQQSKTSLFMNIYPFHSSQSNVGLMKQNFLIQSSRKYTQTSTVYSTLLSKNSRYVLFILCGAFLGEIIYTNFIDTIWNLNNRG